LRHNLLDFVANLSSWDAAIDETMIKTARKLIETAYPEGRPLVIDPFAGIGSIPFETLRLGADAFAADLNPVAVLLLKHVLEDIPKFGKRLLEAVKKWGIWVRKSAEHELQSFYPVDEKGNIPLAYLWARTIRCEGPGCGAAIPLVGLVWLSQKDGVALRYRGDKKQKKVIFDIYKPRSNEEIQGGIVNRFTATCPVCDYTTPYIKVGDQLRKQRGGTKEARLIAVITIKRDGGREFRPPNEKDLQAAREATATLERLNKENAGQLPLVPQEPLPPQGTLGFRMQKYGMKTWEDVFTARQALSLSIFARVIHSVHSKILEESGEPDFARAVSTCLSLAITGNLAPFQSSLSFYSSDHMRSIFMQGMAIPMRPDFAEANPLMPSLVGGFDYAVEQLTRFLEREASRIPTGGTVHRGSATNIQLPDQSVQIVVTDPPYYDAIPYGALSDFCYVWLKRFVGEFYPDLFHWNLAPKTEECIVDPGPSLPGEPKKDRSFFENCIRRALTQCKRVLQTGGVAVVLFAHKGTAGWEALLKALVDAGWTVTASWPIETERGARMRARNSAVLASSVFLVCRPRLSSEKIGDWREILSELQPRVNTWMKRLVKEGIIGADAIFACIGPALEIYSKYGSVETAGGKKIELADKFGKKGELVERGFLSYVWEAVAKEALSMIFEEADPSGFEQDSRLTAMWLWTLRTGTEAPNQESPRMPAGDRKKSEKTKGYQLEYDAVRKIAQGLGAHLEELGRSGGIVEIKGNMATLLFATERRGFLFEESGEEEAYQGQRTLDGNRVSGGLKSGADPEKGKTTLDRLHQAMLLFGDGKSEALRRFLVNQGVGKDDGFWRLANALSALYPKSSDEKRWVEGVLGRKKSLGF
jgi:adenine-specific DNA methylase